MPGPGPADLSAARRATDRERAVPVAEQVLTAELWIRPDHPIPPVGTGGGVRH